MARTFRRPYASVSSRPADRSYLDDSCRAEYATLSMTPKRKKPGRKKPQRGGAVRRAGAEVAVRRVPGEEAWELVHPRCARERADDLEEVQMMLAEGETEIAVDELRWLISGCSDFVQAHGLLGLLALSEHRDYRLARGHFGYAYQLGIKALQRAGMPAPLPYRLPANQPFFEAGKGLALCLKELGRAQMAREVLDQLLQLDPGDALALAAMRAELEGLADTANEEE